MSEITLLDGAIGQELVKRSGDRATPLWSTQVMIDHPDMVGAVHGDYFAAGATVATTNTYAVHVSRLERVGLEAQMPVLLDTAVSQARAARDAHGSGRIAGSMGPLLASYRPDLEPDEDMAAERFRDIAARLVPHVDVILLETVSSLREARGALAGVAGLERPVWVAFSVDDHDGTVLRSGEPLADVLPLLPGHDVAAVMINCCRPEVVADGLAILAQSDLPTGAYANGFTHISEGFKADAPTVDALEQRDDMTPARYADIAMEWVAQGARIVGGCCEIGPEHIAELARRLRAAGHTIV